MQKLEDETGPSGMSLDLRCIHTLRFLSMDIVDRAKSGHPGTPMGAADMTFTLWDRFLKHNPKNPDWIDRDRFILSPGHASALLYSLLYLTGYDLSMEELKNFRQWGSKTPGHPEYGLTPGVSVTTGPLGQGFAHGVGMSIAERFLSEHYNRPHHEIINHYTYALVSDGDMEEGVTSEAASLAGTLRLGKLIYLYDENGIQIEGSTDMTFGENVARRFDAYGWQVIGPINGTDLGAMSSAIVKAQEEIERPSLIICKTVIGHCSPIEGSPKVHGEPLTDEEAREAKESCGWPLDRDFYVADDVLEHFRKAVGRGEAAEKDWKERFEDYSKDYPELAKKFVTQIHGELPQDWDTDLDENALFPPGTADMATRDASGKVMNLLVRRIHALTGGSGDVAPSTKTVLYGYGNFGWQEHSGHNIHFGVREHAMGSIAGGMALHGGLIPYTATYLTFSDYMRPPMRLAAMMGIRVIYIFTHDSIGLGQDGPTHQPIEQLMNLRAVPNLAVIRPSDATETVEAWKAALLRSNGPTVLVFSRQKLPVVDRTRCSSATGLQRGGYVLWDSNPNSTPDLILLSTGSEVQIALRAAQELAKSFVKVRVVSIPCWKFFDEQPEEYRESVLPTSVQRRISVEAGTTFGWEHYLIPQGRAVGMHSFGASAPAEVLYEKFGITAEHVIQIAEEMLG